MKRKSPIKHHVKSYKRKGKLVHDYLRGSGQKTQKVATPTVKPKTAMLFNERRRLLKKLGFPEWGGHYREDLTFEQLPSGIKGALLKERQREQRIINKFKNDPAKMQVELVLDHAKRLVDSGKYVAGLSDRSTHESDVAWNNAVHLCRYQYKGVLGPFSREVDLTEEYIDKLEKYASKVQKKREKGKEQEVTESLGIPVSKSNAETVTKWQKNVSDMDD